MLVISDTSVVSNLALVGRLELLFKLFRDIVIPATVFDELGRLSGEHAVRSIGIAVENGFLKVEQLSEAELSFAASMIGRLDRGEAEAIALARSRKADLLCIDEARGRKVAAEHGLRIKGLLGLLVDAKFAGHIDAIGPCLDELRDKANFFMSDDLKFQILELAGE